MLQIDNLEYEGHCLVKKNMYKLLGSKNPFWRFIQWSQVTNEKTESRTVKVIRTVS